MTAFERVLDAVDKLVADSSREPPVCAHNKPLRFGCAGCFHERDLGNLRVIVGILAIHDDRRTHEQRKTLGAFISDFYEASK